MRIISKFKDYYDGVQSYNHDPSTVFYRHTSEEILKFPGSPEKYKDVLPDVRLRSFRPVSSQGFLNTVTIYPISLIFCGKRYNALRVKYTLRISLLENRTVDTTCWSKDSLTRALQEIQCPLPEIHVDFLRYEPIDRYFESNGIKVNPGLFTAEDTILAIHKYFPEFRSEILSRNEYVMFRNPNLSNLQFAKVMDPFTTYQEIDMFLSGVLAPENKPLEKIADKYKIQQHGFDTRFGFRTRPKT